MNKAQNNYERITKMVIELENKFYKSDDYDFRQKLRAFIASIRRDAITLRKLFEHQCNGCLRDKLPGESWSDYDLNREAQMEWVEKRVEVIEKRIDKKCKELNLPYYIQSDPRGASLYLGTNSDCNYNTEGVAIY